MNNKLLIFISKLIVSLVLIWIVMSNMNIEAIKFNFKDIRYEYIFFSIIVFWLLIINNTLRWVVVLDAIKVVLPFGKVMQIIYIATFFNQVLPSSIGGDALRIFLVRKAGAELKSAVTGVMLERLATISGLILLIVISQPFLLSRVSDNEAKYIFPILAIIALIGITVLICFDRIPSRFHVWKILRALAVLASDTKKIFLSPRHAITTIILGMTGNALIAMMAYFIFCAIKIDVSALDCLVLIPPVILITAIPISIAGWGVREGAMVGAFAFVGMLHSDAFLGSVLFGVLLIVFSLPGGWLWLKGGYAKA